MNYKYIFKNQSLRFRILKALSFIPDSIMLRLQYFVKLNRLPNIKKPKRYTEKLQKYKIDYRDLKMSICVDKFEVRGYVKSKGLQCILNDLYGVYNSASEIKWNNLPKSFVLKTTDGTGGQNVILCLEKEMLNISNVSREVDSWLNKKNINAGREWAYTQMKSSRIIAEKLLVNRKNPEAGINDYKIICFKGKPKVIIVDVDRYIGHKRNFYDCEWNYLGVESDCCSFGDKLPKPKNLDRMLEVASILSEDFPHVRVDLYDIDDKIIFGELTFYPWSGYVQFTPDSFDYELGKDFDI